MSRRSSTAAALAVAAGALLAASLPALPAAAAPAAGRAGHVAHAPRATPPVTRLVVRTRDGRAPSSGLRAAIAGAVHGGVAPAAATRRIGGGESVVPLGRSLPVAAAWAAARAVSARPDVLWAEPDLWVRADDASPVVPADPAFGAQWDLWDQSASAVDGGWSTRAPGAWGRTTGSPSVVVAVLDTGLTVHEDLTSSVTSPAPTDPVVPGYDFVSGDGASVGPETYRRAKDGDGWDPDPSDPGDWVSASDSTALGCPQWPSSWHGTHVTGTIVARQGNGRGISGIAPGVKVEPVRVLGTCGGLSSDIAAAIRWAAGDPSVLGTANPHPATVISLSLGGPGSCLASTQSAIDDARSRGVTVVVAAGNDGASVDGEQPADCAHVIRVGASTRSGAMASYSDLGSTAHPLTIAAPGGAADPAFPQDDVLSTYNNGTTVPTTDSYAFDAGTSMATPHVAAAVALLQSRVSTRLTPDQVAARLAATARPWPVPCPAANAATACGPGLLDIAAALVDHPDAPASASASPSHAAAFVTWDAAADNGAPVTAYRVRASVDGGAARDVATDLDPAQTSLRVTQLADGTPVVDGSSYVFTVSAVNAVGEGPAATTAAVVPSASPPPDQPAAPTAVGGVERVSVSWQRPAAGPDPTGYAVRVRPVGSTAWTCAAGTGPAVDGCATVDAAQLSLVVTTWPAPMAAGRYQVQVVALGAAGSSVWSDSAVTTVTALAQSLRLSAASVLPYRDGFRDDVALTVASNRPGGDSGQVRLVGPTGAVVRSIPVSFTGQQTVRWAGTDAVGLRVAYGRYAVVVLLRGRDGSLTALPRPAYVTVASSQASRPALTLSRTSLFPYPDGYRDSITVRAVDSVPSTFTVRVVRSGRTYWRADYSRRLSLTAGYAGWRTGGGRLPAGTYAVVVTAQGGEGRAVSASTSLTVSAQRAVRSSFTVLTTSLSTLEGVLGSGPLPSPWGTRGVAMPDQSEATFSRRLPSTVLPYRSVRVAVRSTGTSGGGTVGAAVPLGGYYSGDPLDPSSYSASVVLRVGTTTLPVAAAAQLAGGRVRWYVANDGTLAGSTARSWWVVDTVTITGYRYVLV